MKEKTVITIEVEYGSEFQQELFQDLWKALEIGMLKYWETKHKSNKVKIDVNNLTKTSK